MKIGGMEVLTMVNSGDFMSEDVARRIGLKFVPMKAQMKMVNSPLDSVLGVAKRVDTTLGEWTKKVDFTTVWIDDYEAVRGMEFLKQYETMIIPHLKKLYIYDGREDVPIVVPTIGVTKPDCKLAVMQMEEKKWLDDVCEWLPTAGAKHTEQSLVIR